MRWLAALLALMAGTVQAQALAPGDYRFELKHDGRSRS